MTTRRPRFRTTGRLDALVGHRLAGCCEHCDGDSLLVCETPGLYALTIDHEASCNGTRDG